MSDLNTLGSALTIVFVVSLLALVAELFYILWRRRVFRRRNPPVHGGEIPEFLGEASPTTSSSKELIYFLCWKNQTRIEPAGDPGLGSDASSPEDPPDVIDVLKLQEMYGPSRVLFTIKEEEREDSESEKCFQVIAGDSPEVAVTIDVDGTDATPFSTPCDSPLYFTPAASPAREIKCLKEGSDLIDSLD